MDDGQTTRLNAALGNRYRIERELGAGGMATVYLADDERHERKVAIKVLKPELTAGAERFLAEIKTTANLQHPNILPLYDSGEADGYAYYVMPFIDGETLADRLSREGRLTVDDAVALVTEVADALHAAHERGVVHRDVKPANILLSRGRPLVADFGIALTLDSTDHARLTGTEPSFLGTPSYMSPEQLSGDYEVDARSDVYSLACVLFALLTGDPPHQGSTLTATLAKKLTQTAPSLSTVRLDVPEHVDRAVARALARVPDERQGSAEAFARELRDPGTGGAVGGVDRLRVLRERTLPRFSLTHRHRLIGRHAELGKLREHLGKALDGHGSFVLIGGEPGVGKTRLAEEILQEAVERGALVVLGHCTQMDSATPYTPIVEQLDYASRLVSPATFMSVLGDSAPEIARLLPRLRKMFPDIPPAPELPPDVQRRNLMQHYREFAERAANLAPIVALYDDLHWSDEATLLLLEHLAPQLASLPILHIGTYRNVEQDIGPAWARTMETLIRQRLADRILLRRMPEDDIAELLAELGGSRPPEGVAHAIFEGTEGNPFFVEEVYAQLADEGRLFDEAGAWRTDLDADELAVPEGVRIVIGQRLERVSEKTRAMLGPAALVGRRFDIGVLQGLEVLDPDALLDALDEAEVAKLIRSDSNGRRPSYGFTHELIRQTLLQRLSTARRQGWHRRIADAIKAAFPDAHDRRAADIAYHLYEAGGEADASETRHFYALAGRQALEGAAFEDALEHVRRAYAVEDGDPPPEQRLVLERIRAEALWGTGIGSWPEAVSTWLGALEMAEALGDGQAVVEISIVVNFGLLALDDHETARATARKGLAVLGDARVPARSLLLGKYGLATTFTDFEGATAALDEAESIALELDDPITLARVLADRSGHLLGWGMPHDAIEAGRRGLERLDVMFDPTSWIIMQSHVLVALHVTALPDEMVGRALELRAYSERYGNLYGLTFAVRALMDHALYTTGDWRTYEGMAATAAQLHAIFPSAAGQGQIFLAQCALNRGDARGAYEMVREGAARTSRVGVWSPVWGGTLLWHAARSGAADLEQRVRDVLQDLPDHRAPIFIGWFDGIMASVDAFARLSRPEDAAALLPLMRTIVERGWKTGGGGLLSYTSAAVAAAAAGDWGASERYFDEADAFCGARIVILPARNRYWRAWMYLRRAAAGDLEAARALAEDARERFERLGMASDVDDCERLLARIEETR